MSIEPSRWPEQERRRGGDEPREARLSQLDAKSAGTSTCLNAATDLNLSGHNHGFGRKGVRQNTNSASGVKQSTLRPRTPLMPR